MVGGPCRRGRNTFSLHFLSRRGILHTPATFLALFRNVAGSLEEAGLAGVFSPHLRALLATLALSGEAGPLRAPDIAISLTPMSSRQTTSRAFRSRSAYNCGPTAVIVTVEVFGSSRSFLEGFLFFEGPIGRGAA